MLVLFVEKKQPTNASKHGNDIWHAFEKTGICRSLCNRNPLGDLNTGNSEKLKRSADGINADFSAAGKEHLSPKQARLRTQIFISCKPQQQQQPTFLATMSFVSDFFFLSSFESSKFSLFTKWETKTCCAERVFYRSKQFLWMDFSWRFDHTEATVHQACRPHTPTRERKRQVSRDWSDWNPDPVSPKWLQWFQGTSSFWQSVFVGQPILLGSFPAMASTLAMLSPSLFVTHFLWMRHLHLSANKKPPSPFCKHLCE